MGSLRIGFVGRTFYPILIAGSIASDSRGLNFLLMTNDCMQAFPGITLVAKFCHLDSSAVVGLGSSVVCVSQRSGMSSCLDYHSSFKLGEEVTPQHARNRYDT